MSNSAVGPGGTQQATNSVSSPMYPDTPWWASLVAVFVTAIVSILGTAYVMGARVPGGPTGTSAVASLFVDTITYMPHIILLFGVLADMVTYDGVWSIPSLVGLLSIFFNYGMQYFWVGIQELFSTAKKVYDTGSTPAVGAPPMKGGVGVPGSFFKNYDGCSVQGFEGFSTEFAPQTLVVTSTVFMYYIFDLVSNRGWLNSIATIFMFVAVYAGQVAILRTTTQDGACSTARYGAFTQALMALFEGIVFGGTSFGIVQTYYPTRLPSSTISPFPRRSPTDLKMGEDGKMYDINGFAWLVLPDGTTIPDTSDDKTKKVVGDPGGTGEPAKGTPSTCST